MKNFSNLIQLLDYFQEDKTCTDYLELKRWNGTPACNHCGSIKVWRTNRGFKCGEKECSKKFTVLTGTIFENTKIKLRYWFAAMYLTTAHKKGISSHQLARDLGITQKTAWFLIHRIRETTKQVAPQKLNNIVEVDEVYIGGQDKNKHEKKRLHKGALNHKAPVMGMLERGGKIILETLPVGIVNGEVLKPVVRENIETSATLMTDTFGGYYGLHKEYAGHETVNHKQKEYVRGSAHTQGIDNFWSLMKRGIYGIYHQVSVKHLKRYCNEFSYRFNTRDLTDTERFEQSFEQMNSRLSYKTLIA